MQGSSHLAQKPTT